MVVKKIINDFQWNYQNINLHKNIKIIMTVVGMILSFVLYNCCCIYGESGKDCYYSFNQIKFNNQRLIHFHHWMIHCILLFLNFFDKKKIYFYLYRGVNLGGVLHGVTSYKDWHRIVKVKSNDCQNL